VKSIKNSLIGSRLPRANVITLWLADTSAIKRWAEEDRNDAREICMEEVLPNKDFAGFVCYLPACAFTTQTTNSTQTFAGQNEAPIETEQPATRGKKRSASDSSGEGVSSGPATQKPKISPRDEKAKANVSQL
jgi:hypothetical protein